VGQGTGSVKGRVSIDAYRPIDINGKIDSVPHTDRDIVCSEQISVGAGYKGKIRARIFFSRLFLRKAQGRYQEQEQKTGKMQRRQGVGIVSDMAVVHFRALIVLSIMPGITLDRHDR
jgi:hypothetical protein